MLILKQKIQPLSTFNMKKIILLLAAIIFVTADTHAQNVGIGTISPVAKLEIAGDLALQKATLTIADGINNDVDLTTQKFSYYRITGPTADFTITGFDGGSDGRILTLVNSTTFIITIANENAGSVATNQIVTGSGADIVVPVNTIANFIYDADITMWRLTGLSKPLSGAATNYWTAAGNNIFNNNTGNVGIGTNAPTTKLTIQTPLNTNGFTHIGGANEIIYGEGIGGVSAAIGTTTNHAFRLNAGGTGRISIYPAGDVVVGSNATGSFGKFTVETPENSYGINQITPTGIKIGTFIGGSSAGIGTYSNTNMRIFCNNLSAMFISAATGNVGIGTSNPTYKLSVLGNIRAQEVVVETGWADYVFTEKYKLTPLHEVEKFIQQNKHLPNIPSAKEVEENGLHLGDVQKRMMEKIEELTLYIIRQQKEIEVLKKAVLKNN